MTTDRSVASAIGSTLVALGVDQDFGVVGSGNFHLTNAMTAAGARFVAARHECGAAVLTDAYARMSGRVTAVTLHQGCGLTNWVDFVVLETLGDVESLHCTSPPPRAGSLPVARTSSLAAAAGRRRTSARSLTE